MKKTGIKRSEVDIDFIKQEVRRRKKENPKERIRSEDFLALSNSRDPFNIQEGNQLRAEWVTEIWKKEGCPVIHARGLHYRILGSGYIIPKHKKRAEIKYINNNWCWEFIDQSLKYARYKNLIPYADVKDEKNQDGTETGNFDDHLGVTYYKGYSYFDDNYSSHKFKIEDKEDEEYFINKRVEEIAEPFSVEFNPDLLQHFYIEIWAEKSGIIPQDIAKKFNATMRPAAGGEFSVDMCYQAVKRAKELNKDLFVFIFSDFDPKGSDMPRSVARKIEFISNELGGVKSFVKHLSLTKEQCIKYDLPQSMIILPKDKTPGTKSYQTHATKHKEYAGRDPTEINVFLAREKQSFNKVVLVGVQPYFDKDMPQKVRDLEEEIIEQIKEVIKEKLEERKEELFKSVRELYPALIEKEEIEERHQKELEEFEEKWDLNTLKNNYDKHLEIDSREIINNLDYEMPEAEFKQPKRVWLDGNLEYEDQLELYDLMGYRVKAKNKIK